MAWALAAMGGVYVWAGMPVIAGALVLGAAVRPHIAAADETRLLDYSLLGVIGGIGLQLVPLPTSLTNWLSPRSAELQTAISLQRSPSDPFTALSVDTAATAYALGLTAAVTVFFWACRDVFHRGGTRRAVRSLAWLGLLASLIALVQTATAPTRVYWFWEPLDGGAFPFGPFINRNHFAAWVIMAIPLVTGYLVARRAREHRRRGGRWVALLFDLTDVRATWLAVATVLMTLGLMLSLSRSGMTALAVVGCVTLWALRRRLGTRDRVWAAGGAILAVIIALGWADVGSLLQEVDAGIDEPSGGRWPIWRDTGTMIEDFWLTGVGAGAYQAAMLVYQQSNRTVFFNQAHNHYLQLAAEGGALLILPSALALAGFVRLARQRLAADRSWRYWLRLGAVVGLGAVAVQSVWESGLRMPANALLFALLAAIVVHAPRRHAQAEAGRSR